MCPGVRSTHVLITSKSSRQSAKPYGIAVSGVLSVGQYVLVAKEKNTATVCGLDKVATDDPFRADSVLGMAANVAAGRCVGDARSTTRIAGQAQLCKPERLRIVREIRDVTST